jgi:hypothetical protein
MDEPNGIQGLDPLLGALADEMAQRVRRRRRRRALGTSGLAFAAAAAIAGLVFVTLEPEAAAPSPEAGLNVESSRSFVVFPTSRDDITVIWLMED